MHTRPTQQQVAELAGVTRATVSYVLAGRAQEMKITDAVVRRVREAARQLDYTPSHAARSLASGKSMTLGLLLGGSASVVMPFWSQIAEGAEAAALGAGYDVLLVSAGRAPAFAGIRYLRQGRVDALIALGQASPTSARAWRQAAVPPVVIQAFGPPGLPTVGLDAAVGLRQAMQHLAGLGHRRLMWLSPGRRHDYGRSAVAQRVAQECGLSIEVVHLDVPARPIGLPPDAGVAFWHDAIGARLSDPLAATAVLCWNDQMALGLYATLAQRGVRVPEQVSVVGFDDQEAALALPPLSSVSHEFHEMGAEATRLALRMVRGELSADAAAETVVLVPSRFVPRQSTGPVASQRGVEP